MSSGMQFEAGDREMIPKRLHQIYLVGELPEVLRANAADHIARNPGWQYTLWTEPLAESFIRETYGTDVLTSYRMIDDRYLAARADLLRHLIIYKLGGVYFDIKGVIERPLDEVLNPTDRYLLSQWDNSPGEPQEGWGLHKDLAHISGGEYVTNVIVAEPSHPYSKAAIEKILKNIANYKPWSAVGRTGTLRTTGPIAYTLAIESVKNASLHRFVDQSELGSRVSIGGTYDHSTALERPHYSTLSHPLVAQRGFAKLVSRAALWLREQKLKRVVRLP